MAGSIEHHFNFTELLNSFRFIFRKLPETLVRYRNPKAGLPFIFQYPKQLCH